MSTELFHFQLLLILLHIPSKYKEMALNINLNNSMQYFFMALFNWKKKLILLTI